MYARIRAEKLLPPVLGHSGNAMGRAIPPKVLTAFGFFLSPRIMHTRHVYTYAGEDRAMQVWYSRPATKRRSSFSAASRALDAPVRVVAFETCLGILCIIPADKPPHASSPN